MSEEKTDKHTKKKNKKEPVAEDEEKEEAVKEKKRNPRNYDDPENKIKLSKFHK